MTKKIGLPKAHLFDGSIVADKWFEHGCQDLVDNGYFITRDQAEHLISPDDGVRLTKKQANCIRESAFFLKNFFVNYRNQLSRLRMLEGFDEETQHCLSMAESIGDAITSKKGEKKHETSRSKSGQTDRSRSP